MTDQQRFIGLGLMSGSSLDGLDLALIEMNFDLNSSNPVHSWKILDTITYNYPNNLVESLQTLPFESAKRFIELDNIFGRMMAEHILDFVKDNPVKIDFIATHGHTIFHQPEISSTQIGNASIIAAKTGITTISNFRNMDTAYGGQGAPLAPVADLYLFKDKDVSINIGGIANASFKQNGKIYGFDICGANQLLNYLSNQVGKEFDDKGDLARSGKVNEMLLAELNKLSYCQKNYPKSLDNQQTMDMYVPILDKYHVDVSDLLATMVEHITDQVFKLIPDGLSEVMLTGGGVFNDFLIEKIVSKGTLVYNISIPDEQIISYKECLLMVLLGAFRIQGHQNCFKTITGASKDTINGLIHVP